jgi:hypothetical protein
MLAKHSSNNSIHHHAKRQGEHVEEKDDAFQFVVMMKATFISANLTLKTQRAAYVGWTGLG